MKIINHPLLWASALITALTLISCDSLNDIAGLTKDDSVTSELFKDVRVTLAGTVTAVDTGDPLPGMTVAVAEYVNGVRSVPDPATTTTDALGNFSISEAVTLKVDENEYYLEVSDRENDAYYANDATVIYAVRDAELTGYAVKLVPRNPVSLTTVSGTVLDGMDRTTALEGVGVTLTNRYDSSLSYAATTDSTGDWSVSAEVGSYRVVYDGSELDTVYIGEYEDKVLRNNSANPLGNHYLVPEIPAGEFRVMLQWDDPDNYELQMFLDIFSSDMPPANNLGPDRDVGSVQIPSRYTINPGSGFAEGSSYWPQAVSPSPYRTYAFAQDRNSDGEDDPYKVGGQNVIEFDRDDANGIEVITFNKRNPLLSFPELLSYYYNYSDGGSLVRHYPIGVYNLMVQLHQRDNENIYGSNARVKLYQGSTFMGSFEVGDFNPNLGESNKLSWDVLFIETGYTFNQGMSDSELYLRPVPFFSTSMETEAWDQPPFVKQTTYRDGANLEGTDSFDGLSSPITALCYDTHWGLFMGTESKGIKALYFDGSEPALFGSFPTADPVEAIEILGEPFVLTVSGGVGTVRDVEGNQVDGGLPATPPADTNCLYASAGVSDGALIAGASDGLWAFRWESDWVNLFPGLTNVTDLYDDRSGDVLPRLVIADGHVYHYDGLNGGPFGEYDQLDAALEPLPEWGILVKGGVYGYVDSLLDGQWNIFWGITDQNAVYVNAVRIIDMTNPSTYEYGTPKLIADLDTVNVYDIEALARPGEDAFGGQPLIATERGVLQVKYDHEAGNTASEDQLDTVFSVEPYPFIPEDLAVRDLEITYETTFFGTGVNGVLHTLGGMF